MKSKSKKFLNVRKNFENLTLNLKIECEREKSIFTRLNIKLKLEMNI